MRSLGYTLRATPSLEEAGQPNAGVATLAIARMRHVALEPREPLFAEFVKMGRASLAIVVLSQHVPLLILSIYALSLIHI
eukprot:5856715-Alexandrium_andersonii.AAC.1